MTPSKFNVARSLVLILTMWTMGAVTLGVSNILSLFVDGDATTIALTCCAIILLVGIAMSGAVLYTVQNMAAAAVNAFLVTLVLLVGIGGFIYSLAVIAPTLRTGFLAALIVFGLVNIAVIAVGFVGALMSVVHLKQAPHQYTELANN